MFIVKYPKKDGLKDLLSFSFHSNCFCCYFISVWCKEAVLGVPVVDHRKFSQSDEKCGPFRLKISPHHNYNDKDADNHIVGITFRAFFSS